MKITGFDWDSGNWPKCGKHGVSREEIEQVLSGEPRVMADPTPDEARMRAIGKTQAGRYLFLVFMLSPYLAVPRINRIISASYTRKKIRVALQTYPKGIRR